MLTRIFLLLTASLPLTVSHAQTAGSEPDEVTAALEVSRSVLNAERQAVIADALPLTREEGEQFWPVYREYRQEADEIMGRRIELIRRFADTYDRMTDDMAEALIKDVLKSDEAETNLKQKYLSRFEKVLPMEKVVVYYQLENKIDTYVRASIVDEVPLLSDLSPAN